MRSVRVKESPKLLKYVYDVFRNDSEDEITREAAYETLALVSGVPIRDLPRKIAPAEAGISRVLIDAFELDEYYKAYMKERE